MSTAEQNYRLAATNAAATAYHVGSAQRPSYEFEEDTVAWPPVIARIRDLDKLTTDKPATAVGATPHSTPPMEVYAAANSPAAKPTLSRRISQKISSRVIACAGIAIFIAAVLPYMYLRDRKATTAEWPDSSPVRTADAAPPAPAGNPTAAIPSDKKPTQPSTNPQAAVTGGDTKPATAAALVTPAAPAAPTLLALPGNAPAPPTVVAAPTANPPAVNNPVANKPAAPSSEVGSQPSNARAGAAQPGGEAKQVAEIIGDFVPLPGAASPKMEPARSEVPTARPMQIPSNSPSPVANGFAMPQTMLPQSAIPGQPALPNQPANPNAPMLSGPALPAGMTAPAMNGTYLPPGVPNIPRPTMGGPSGDPRYPYPLEADARNNVRSRYDATPDYRKPPVNTQAAPNGQPVPNGQQPPADWRTTPAGVRLPPAPFGCVQYPPSNVRPGTAPQQLPSQANPYPPASSPYPSNQALPQNPNPATAPSAWQGGGYPPPAYNNVPNAAPPAAYPSNRDGYSAVPAVPPAIDTPPARY